MNKKLEIGDVRELVAVIPGFESYVVHAVDDGVSTEVFKLTHKETVFYLRIANENESMASEALVHNLLLEKGVEVPQVLVCGDQNNVLGRSYMVTSEMPGVPYKKDRMAGSDVVFEAGKQLALINSVSVKNFGWVDVTNPSPKELTGCYSTYREFALNQERIEAMLKDLLDLEKMDDALARKYLKHVKEEGGF
ncbi:MAG: phosphotransferase, partial [Patescibacteria group bacterium]